MPGLYVKIDTIPGPVIGTAALGGLPAGVDLNKVFNCQGASIGTSNATSFLDGTSGGSGRPPAQATDLGFAIDGSTAEPRLFLASVSGAPLRVALIGTSAPTGGLSTDWVSNFWLLEEAHITVYSSYAESGRYPYLNMFMSYRKLTVGAIPKPGTGGSTVEERWDFLESRPF